MTGSGAACLPETQEMLDFCAEHNVVSDIELIAIQDIQPAFERMLKGDVRYRFVIDMATLYGPGRAACYNVAARLRAWVQADYFNAVLEQTIALLSERSWLPTWPTGHSDTTKRPLDTPAKRS